MYLGLSSCSNFGQNKFRILISASTQVQATLFENSMPFVFISILCSQGTDILSVNSKCYRPMDKQIDSTENCIHFTENLYSSSNKIVSAFGIIIK